MKPALSQNLESLVERTAKNMQPSTVIRYRSGKLQKELLLVPETIKGFIEEWANRTGLTCEELLRDVLEAGVQKIQEDLTDEDKEVCDE